MRQFVKGPLEFLLEPTLRAIRKDIDGGKLWAIDDVVKMLSTDKSWPK
jgi:hypothetical protein